MNETTEKTMKACPQCDGTGREEFGKVIMCRKCAGAGVTESMAKTSAIMCGDGIEKTAKEDELPDLGIGDDEVTHEPIPESIDGGRILGSGIDPYSGLAMQQSDDEIRNDIISFMNGMNPGNFMRCMEKASEIMQMDVEKERSTWVDKAGNPSLRRLADAMYRVLPTMNAEQLKELFATVRSI